MIFICGIDPGKQGGLAFKKGNEVKAISFTKLTKPEIAYSLKSIMPDKVYLEKVHSMPKQGVTSVFKFGEGFGHLKGVLDALCIPYELVSPIKWQTKLSCRTGGDKNISKEKAQQLFPQVPKITHAVADALLIMEYGFRQEAVKEIE